jgi:hypothetical protein
VTSTASAQKDLENTVVRFRWVDGFVVAVEADTSAKIEHVNFVKGVLSVLQVNSPVPIDGETIVRSYRSYLNMIILIVVFHFRRYVKKMYSAFALQFTSIHKRMVAHK